MTTQAKPPRSTGPSSHTSTRSDNDLLKWARHAKNGPKFVRLYDAESDTGGYPSDSEADCGLLVMLAYWTGADAGEDGTAVRHGSVLARRGKWADRSDYRQVSIDSAIRLNGGKAPNLSDCTLRDGTFHFHPEAARYKPRAMGGGTAPEEPDSRADRTGRPDPAERSAGRPPPASPRRPRRGPNHGEGQTLAYHQETFSAGTAPPTGPTRAVPVILVNEIKSELDRLNVIALETWERQTRLRALAGGTGKNGPALRSRRSQRFWCPTSPRPSPRRPAFDGTPTPVLDHPGER